MKPWEENWIAEEGDVITSSGECIFDESDCGVASKAVHEPRASLASAAPDMARVLLSLEWSGRLDYVGDGGYNCCPSCGGVAPEDAGSHDARHDVSRGRNVVGHRDDCAWDAALRKAGVR